MRRLTIDAGRRLNLCRMGMLAVGGVLASAPPGVFAASPRRIVAVGGAITEIIYALQANAELVGVDTTSLFPAAALTLPNVGYARALSAEGVLALAPTQLIATEDAGPPAVIRQIGAAGVPVAVLAANHRFEGLVERVQRVGELTDRKAAAQKLVAQLQQNWARTRRQIDGRAGKPLKVMFVLAHSPSQIMVGGRETAADAVIAYAGARNAIADFSGYKPLTPEAVVAAQPDVILLTEQGVKANGGLAGILALPGMSQTPAGQRKRVVSFEAMYLLGFGPRLPDAVAALDGALTKAMAA